MTNFVSGAQGWDPDIATGFGLTGATAFPEDVARLGYTPGHERQVWYPDQSIAINIAAGGNPANQPTVPGSVDSWRLYDDVGAVYRSGGAIPSGQKFQTAPLDLGFYHWRGQRGSSVPYFRKEQGQGTIAVVRRYPAGMGPGADAVFPDGGVGGKFGAEGMSSSCLVMFGMTRGEINNLNDPVNADELGWNGSSFANLDAQYVPYQTHREKPRYVALGNGPRQANLNGAMADANEAEIKAKLATAINHPSYQSVDVWSWINEPGGARAFGDWYVEQARMFYEGVHAARAGTKVVGPNTVGFTEASLPGMLAFAKAGGLNYTDIFGYHAYNSLSPDLAVARRLCAKYNAILDQYAPGKKRANTEAFGYMAIWNGEGRPVDQAKKIIGDVLLMEGLLKTPKEYQSMYNTQEHGDPHRSSMANGHWFTGYGALYHHSWEVGQCEQYTGVKPLEFGNDENVLYGNEYEYHDGRGRLMAVMDYGRRGATAKFRVTKGSPAALRAGTIKWEGSFNVEDDKTFDVPLGWSPTYLTVPDGVEIEYVEEPKRGRLLNGSAMALTPENFTPAGTTRLNSLLSGEYLNGRANERDPSDSYEDCAFRPSRNLDQDGEHSFVVRLPITTSIKMVRGISAPADQWLGAPRHVIVETRVGNGAWAKMAELQWSEPDNEWRTFGDLYNGFRVTFTENPRIMELWPEVPPTADQIRYRILDATTGDAPNALALTGYGATKPHVVSDNPRTVVETSTPIENAGFPGSRIWNLERVQVFGGDDVVPGVPTAPTGPTYSGPKKYVVAAAAVAHQS